MMRTRLGFAALVLLIAIPAQAQQVRGSLSNTARYIELRPIARDTVDSLSTTLDPNGRPTFEGRPVFCAGQTCTFYRPADVAHTVAMSQDLSVSAWGFGVQGVSATVLLRARQDVAGEFTWPRYEDSFSAILAYAELGRERYRIRAGRQRSLTGMGFYSFDGLSANVTAASWANVEVYGGRSLARALEEPRHEALSSVENFIPDNNAWLIGAAAELHVANGTAGSIRYQREIWSDRAALVSERASVDFRSSIMRVVNVEASADYDVAYNRLGKAHVTFRRQFINNRLSVDATMRRYLPFFELWTIWGVFSPVAYHEAELQAGWRSSARFDVSASAGFRKFEDTEAEVFIAAAEDQTWNVAVRAGGEIRPGINAHGEYRLERGFGAYLSSGEGAVNWEPADRIQLGAYVTAFQQIMEFRIGEAAVFGGGLTAEVALHDAIGLNGGFSVYHQAFDNRPSAVDWNQKRGWLGIEWSFGRDPGLASNAQ